MDQCEALRKEVQDREHTKGIGRRRASARNAVVCWLLAFHWGHGHSAGAALFGSSDRKDPHGDGEVRSLQEAKEKVRFALFKTAPAPCDHAAAPQAAIEVRAHQDSCAHQ